MSKRATAGSPWSWSIGRLSTRLIVTNANGHTHRPYRVINGREGLVLKFRER